VTLGQALAAAAGLAHSQPYQSGPLTSFMHPGGSTAGIGYQVKPVLDPRLALAGCGAIPRGGPRPIWRSCRSRQTTLSLPPFAEEHGFVGALAVLLLYFVVLMRLTQNAQTAPTRLARFVVMGVVAVL